MTLRLPDHIAAVSVDTRLAALVLVLVSLLSFLPGFFSLPVVDRDEARYAQASRQMVASGDWIDIRLQDEPRHKQPAGIYWAQSLFVSAFGRDGIAPIWVHRLPSLISATVAVLLTYWVALPLVGAGAALLAGLTMAVSLILGVEARLAKTDATLLATVLAAQGVLARAYLSFKNDAPDLFSGNRAWWLPLCFWTALAAGMLVKAPMLLFVGGTVVSLVILERSGGFLLRLRPVPGVIWFLVLVLPWYIAIGFRTEGAFFDEAIGVSVVGKISQSHEGHGAPPLTHLAWFWGIFWPGSLFFALSLVGIWKRRREPWVRFLLCWAVPSWIVFEAAVTKLPHYLLPVFPAVAIASAGILSSREMLCGSRGGRRAVTAVLLILTVVAIGAAVGGVWYSRGEAMSPVLVLVFVVSLVLFSCTSRWCVRALRESDLTGCYAALVAGMVAFYWLFVPSLARIPALWPAPAIGALITSAKHCEQPFLVSAGYFEPSLVFYTRTDIVFASGRLAAVHMADRGCAVGVIEVSQLPAFLLAVQDVGLAVERAGRVSGYNIGAGRPLDVTVFTSRPDTRVHPPQAAHDR